METPKSTDIENIVIGSIIAHYSYCSLQKEFHLLTIDDFYTEENKEIFKIIQLLVAEFKTVDLQIVNSKLKDFKSTLTLANLIKKVGAVDTCYNFSIYCNILFQKKLARKLIEKGVKIAELGYAEEIDIFERLDTAYTAIDDVKDCVESCVKVSNSMTVKEMTEMSFNENLPKYYSSIFRTEWFAGQFYGFTATTGSAKTTYLIAQAVEFANQGFKVYYLCGEGNVKKINKHCKHLRPECNENLIFDFDTQTLEEAERRILRKNYQIIIIDHFGLYDIKEKKNEQDWLTVKRKSVFISNLAKKYQLLILVAAQNNEGKHFMKSEDNDKSVASGKAFGEQVALLYDIQRYKEDDNFVLLQNNFNMSNLRVIQLLKNRDKSENNLQIWKEPEPFTLVCAFFDYTINCIYSSEGGLNETVF